MSVVETASDTNIRHILCPISLRHLQVLSAHPGQPCTGMPPSSLLPPPSLPPSLPLPPSLSFHLSPPSLPPSQYVLTNLLHFLTFQEVKTLPDEQLDRVLLLVYDMDNIMLQMRTEKEDQDLRKTYGFLFQFLKKNMLQPKLPSLAREKLGVPPFEKPSIAKVQYKSTYIYVAVLY